MTLIFGVCFTLYFFKLLAGAGYRGKSGENFCHCSRQEAVLFGYFLYDLIKLSNRDLLAAYDCC